MPIGRDAVRQGPRACAWRPDRRSTLYWFEAADDGDPAREADVRDRLFQQEAPFEHAPAPLVELELRARSVLWGNDSLALVREEWHKTRQVNIWRINPGQNAKPSAPAFRFGMQDRYADPGTPLLCANGRGGETLRFHRDGESLLLAGPGGGNEGDRPFIDAWHPDTGHSNRLWQSRPPNYEQPLTLSAGGELLFTRESVTEPPGLFVSALKQGGDARRLTAILHPAPALAKVEKRLIQYARADGVNLTGTLYLPPGKSEADGPFPTLLWAYPSEFKDAASAGQIKTSPHRFPVIDWRSPLVWLLRGYAVLDRPDIPIIGQGAAEPNDTYIEQLVASAAAAVAELLRRGVAEQGRIAVGGHSYGAFMTANLLAHTRLFCAGIARSGAYNRTLTPFTFQAEERTLWQAPATYLRMSPFMHADRIRDPLLLIHGMADENEGTFTMQSERFYQALKGLGVPARLVLLPCERHAYRARESVMHMLWETEQWLARYLEPDKV